MKTIYQQGKQCDQKWLAAFRACVEEQLHRTNLTAKKLAELMSYSERQFYRKMKKLTGQSPSMLLKEARLQRAYQYLKVGEYETVAETAKPVGFKDVVYFSRQFQKWFGVRPSKVKAA